MKPYFKNFSHAVAGLLLFTFFSCQNYYKATSVSYKNDTEKAVQLDSLKRASRDFILRDGRTAFYMSNATISPDQKELICTLDTLSANNKLHLHKGRNGKMRYKKSNPNEFSVLNETHIYTNSDNTAALGNYSLPLNKIEKIEVIEKDKARTNQSYILGGIAVTACTLVVAGVIIASTLSFDFSPH